MQIKILRYVDIDIDMLVFGFGVVVLLFSIVALFSFIIANIHVVMTIAVLASSYPCCYSLVTRGYIQLGTGIEGGTISVRRACLEENRGTVYKIEALIGNSQAQGSLAALLEPLVGLPRRSCIRY